jgi:hypothetical protein
MINYHKAYFQQQFLRLVVRWKPFYNEQIVMKDLKEDNTQRSSQFATKCQEKCIAEFNRQVGIIMAMSIDEPGKYGKLIQELEVCLRQYYDKLPWPLNDQTIGVVDDKLQRIFHQVMQNLFTSAVKERLKSDRVKQLATMSRLNLDGNESLLWVYCVSCRKIFAGRTRGCVKVTCCHFDMKSGAKNVDHGCGLEFEWAKAQPVPIDSLPPDIWFSNIETDQRGTTIRNLLSDKRDIVRKGYNARPITRRRSFGDQ